MNKKIKLNINTAFGLEGVLKKELLKLGYQDLKVADGQISFMADSLAVARCNIFLRTAERVSIILFQGVCSDFDTLFDKVTSICWESYFLKDSKIDVMVKSKKSKLLAIPTLQGMIKKGIIKRLSSHFKVSTFKENGSSIKVQASFNKDLLTLTIDTSGDALHKRGYRVRTGDAPLKETLAAGIVLLSNWNFRQPFYDPFCGSGTILIEAAMIALNKAPGLDRSFSGMKFPLFDKKIWKDAAKEAIDKERLDIRIKLYGSDIDYKIINIAIENAKNCEVEEYITFFSSDFKDVKYQQNGIVISNPPYGERIGNKDLLFQIKTILLKVANQNKLKLNILTGDEDFSENLGFKPNNRKLYNGRLKCYFYKI